MSSALRLYKEELARCQAHFEKVDLKQERGYLMKFTTFSANVENIMPRIPRSEHEALFRDLLLQQIFTTFDHTCLTAGDLAKIEGDGLANPGEGARIYCTYHLGSYRMLTSVLYRKGVDCVLLVGSNMHQSQGDDLTAHIDALRRERGLNNLFRIVDAGHPSAALSVLRELKAGRSLIVYVDGSPETAPEPGDEAQFLSVQFGQREVLTRKGVGYLSHAAGVPIVPVVSHREADFTNVLQCLDTIRPEAGSDREEYCRQALQQLYNGFWDVLNRYPSQWEGWNYIQSFLKPEAPVQNKTRGLVTRPVFNVDRYSLCELEQASILFDRRLYQTYEITDDLRDLLLNINTVDSVQGLVGDEMFNELIGMEVLC